MMMMNCKEAERSVDARAGAGKLRVKGESKKSTEEEGRANNHRPKHEQLVSSPKKRTTLGKKQTKNCGDCGGSQVSMDGDPPPVVLEKHETKYVELNNI